MLNSLPDKSCFDVCLSSSQKTFDDEYFVLLLCCIKGIANLAAISLEITKYKAEAHYWKAQHEQAVQRELELKKRLEEMEAKLKLREQQLFGKKTEKGGKRSEKSGKPNKRPRGQQKGSVGHGRLENPDLPCKHETLDLPEDKKSCPICGLFYEELPGTSDSEIIGIVDVQAHKRILRRKMYKRTCSCPSGIPQIITAPQIPKLIRKSKIDISLWVKILAEKYVYQRPIYRFLKVLKERGLSLAQGTITDGLKKLLPLFIPIYDAFQKKCLEDKHWHADESRWSVFQPLEGKTGNRWWLWVFKSKAAVIFKIAPNRSSVVAKDFFKNIKSGILSVDRYVVYKVIAKLGVLILAFCWAHVRRDFLGHAKKYPRQSEWAFEWVELINELYHINNQRILFEKGTKSFLDLDNQLRSKIQLMETRYLKELKEPSTYKQAEKLLESLKNHWDGLTVFVDHPEVPMDNNAAERQLRNGIVGRKNYYGSGSIWSSQLSAMLFSIFETLEIWNVNKSGWLTYYLQSCANNKGEPPDNIDEFLPWNMSEKTKAQINQYWNTS